MADTGDFGPAYKRPDWAISDEIDEGGDMIFRDGEGQRLLGIAFTEAELSLLRRGLTHLPQNEDVKALHGKLRSDV